MITYDNIESACSVVRETITEMSMSKGSQQASVFCGNERHETKGSSAIVTLAGKFPCHLDKAIEVTNKATLSMVLPHVAAPWNKDKKCETVILACAYRVANAKLFNSAATGQNRLPWIWQAPIL